MRVTRQGLLSRARTLPPAWQWLSLAWIALWALLQWRVHEPGILGDMWDILPAYQQLGTTPASDLLAELMRRFAAVHVLFLPKLLFWANLAWDGGSGALLRAISFGLCLLAWLQLHRLSTADSDAHAPADLACWLAGLLLFINGFQLLAIDWDFLVQHYLAIVFTLAAFAAVGGHALSPARFALACAALTAACLSCGAGLAGLLAFGFLLLTRRAALPWLAAYAAVAAALVLLVHPETPRIQAATGEWLTLDDYARLHDFPLFPFFWNAPLLYLQYLAYPFSAWGAAYPLGALVLAAGVHAAWRCVVQRDAPLREHLLCYFLLVGATIAWGRYRLLGHDADLSRYYMYIAPVWFLVLLKLRALGGARMAGLALAVSASVAIASFTGVVVAADHAGKIALSRTVALNGNTAHLASLRRNAAPGAQRDPLATYRDYLQSHNLDIYRQLRRSVADLPIEPTPCPLTLVHSRATTKGRFVDHVLRGTDAHGAPLAGLLVSDGEGRVTYHGTVLPAGLHLETPFLPLAAVRPPDLALLLPTTWRAATEQQLYLHLPREPDPAARMLWGITRQHTRCPASVSDSPSPAPGTPPPVFPIR